VSTKSGEQQGTNCTQDQAKRWAGEFPLTLLNEALQKLAPCLSFKSTSELVKHYPSKNKRVLDRLLHDIGMELLMFPHVRDSSVFFGSRYGVSPVSASTGASTQGASGSRPEEAGQESGTSAAGTTTASGPRAYASNDPRSVKRALKRFIPRGLGRDKVVTLCNELKNINIEKCPHAFCFLLRSVFELSAEAYCADHQAASGPSMKKGDGSDKHLVDVLSEIKVHLTKNGQDKNMTKRLHGAITELARPSGLLSVTSMNQLVHNPHFLVLPADICTLFSKVMPLLEEMNA